MIATTPQNDSDIWWLWKSCRKDTAAIAAQLKLQEAYVACRLTYMRDIERSKLEKAPA